MKKFKIRIEEKLRKFVDVKAENYAEAEEKLQKQYKNQEIVLGADDFAGVTFSLQGVEYEYED